MRPASLLCIASLFIFLHFRHVCSISGGLYELNRIILVPFGEIDILEDICEAVANVIEREVTIAPAQADPRLHRRGAQLLADDYLPTVASSARAEVAARPAGRALGHVWNRYGP